MTPWKLGMMAPECIRRTQFWAQRISLTSAITREQEQKTDAVLTYILLNSYICYIHCTYTFDTPTCVSYAGGSAPLPLFITPPSFDR